MTLPTPLRLHAALDLVRAAGYAAEAAFTCCGSCGHHEMSTRDDARDGYLFWNAQTQDSAFGEPEGMLVATSFGGPWYSPLDLEDEDIDAFPCVEVIYSPVMVGDLYLAWYAEEQSTFLAVVQSAFTSQGFTVEMPEDETKTIIVKKP